MLHWGGRILRDADIAPARQSRGFAFESPAGLTPEEFPAFGGMRYHEPCLKVTFADGVRDLDLVFLRDKIENNPLDRVTPASGRFCAAPRRAPHVGRNME